MPTLTAAAATVSNAEPDDAGPPSLDCAIASQWNARHIVSLAVRGVPAPVAAVVCDAMHGALRDSRSLLDQRSAHALCRDATALRIFEKVQLTAAAVGDDVALTLALTVAPRIVDVTLDPGSERNVALTPLLETRGASWAPERIELLRNAAQDLLIGDGYTAASLTVTTQRTDAGVSLRLMLARGERALLDQIVVVGNHVMSQAETERLLAIDNPGFNRIGGVPSVAMVQRYFEPRLQSFFRNRGYLEVRVSNVALQPRAPGSNRMSLVITVVEGRQFTLGKVVDNSRQPHPAAFALALALGLGQPVNAAFYAHVVGEFSRTAAHAGFGFSGDWESRADSPHLTIRFSLWPRVESKR